MALIVHSAGGCLSSSSGRNLFLRPPLSAALTFPLAVTEAAEGRPDGLTLHFLLRRQRADRCQGARGLAAAWALDEAGESMERGMMKK